MFPTAIVPYTYFISFFFNDEISCQNFTIIHNIFIGGLLPIVLNVLRLIDLTKSIGDILIWLPRIFPIYNVCNGIIVVSFKNIYANLYNNPGLDAFSFEVAGGDVIFLGFHFFFWSILVVLIESGWWNWLRRKGKTIIDPAEVIDDDVIDEQKRIEQTSESQLAVKANHLRKVYGSKVAVKDVSFGLDFGDWFALLGVNGAGKTTTFRMLTNEYVPTTGESFISGYNVKTQFSFARKQIGYCPQFDAIFNLMTVREHLEFYGRIKRIPRHLIEPLIQAQLKSMNLETYEKKLAGTLSGGNKRKLSVAMAMLGNPPVVFLDEPSAGMDPKARRFMWDVISKISTRGKNSAVILTTHSMEEAEALSTNMGIMVDGQFKCFGSKQHIKNKFGVGYQVEIKFRIPSIEAIKNKIDELNIINYLKNKHLASYKVEKRKGVETVIVNKEACLGILKNIFKNQNAIEEFNIKGFGKEIVEVLNKQSFYSLKSLIEWEYIIKNNMKVLQSLVSEFGSALLLEQYFPRYRYRVPKGRKSVGHFFTFIENLKSKFDVDEYSASQTTLEQIFNSFARIEEKEIIDGEFHLSQENIAFSEVHEFVRTRPADNGNNNLSKLNEYLATLLTNYERKKFLLIFLINKENMIIYENTNLYFNFCST